MVMRLFLVSVLIARNQRCRDCLPKLRNDGQPAGYDVCGYVARDASCSCKFEPACQATVDTCSYYG